MKPSTGTTLNRLTRGASRSCTTKKLVDIYDDANIACEQGLERYGSGNYSIVWIGAKPLSLGIFTFALN